MADEQTIETVRDLCEAMHDAGGPVPLAELARRSGWSVRHLHRRFATVTGTSPRAYGEAVRADAARRALPHAATVVDAAFGAGYGSTRGFYEQMKDRLPIEPARYARRGAGEQLRWGGVDTALGVVLAVVSPAGVVAVRVGDEPAALEAELRAELAAAELVRDDVALAPVLDALAALAAGRAPLAGLPLDVRGTAFQVAVWQELRRIPRGETRTYAQIAAALGRASAVRAVAAACAANPAALVVPCHRVVRTDGGLAGYRWGVGRKAALLAAERGAIGNGVPRPNPAGAAPTP